MHYQRRLCCKELYNIRKINRRICSVYFKPTLKYIRIVRYNLKKIFHILMNINYTSIHLRIGDGKQTFQKILLISNMLSKIFIIKNELSKIIYNDFNIDRRYYIFIISTYIFQEIYGMIY